MFNAMQFSELIVLANDLVKKYQIDSPKPRTKNIPYTDCIVPLIDEECGTLKGFTIRVPQA
jgi:hypothetical protein